MAQDLSIALAPWDPSLTSPGQILPNQPLAATLNNRIGALAIGRGGGTRGGALLDAKVPASQKGPAPTNNSADLGAKLATALGTANGLATQPQVTGGTPPGNVAAPGQPVQPGPVPQGALPPGVVVAPATVGGGAPAAPTVLPVPPPGGTALPPATAPAAIPAAQPQTDAASAGGPQGTVSTAVPGNAAPAQPTSSGALPKTQDDAAPADSGGVFGFLDRNLPDVSSPNAPTTDAQGNRLGLLDRILADPQRMALVTGGLATMAASAQPGATLPSALGEGLLTGVSTVTQQRAAMREAALEAAKEASEEQLRTAQGQFYSDRGQGALMTGQGSLDRGQAAVAKAEDQNVSYVDGTQPGPDGKPVQGLFRFDKTGKAPPQFIPGESVQGTGRSGALGQSVFEQKRQAYLAVPGNENDLSGALEYASGHRQLTQPEINRSAYSLAEQELKGMIQPPPDPKIYVDQRAREIAANLAANQGAPGALPAPGPVSTPVTVPPQAAGAVPAPAQAQGGGALPQGGKQNAPKAAPPRVTPPSAQSLKASAKAAIQRHADRNAVIGRLKTLQQQYGYGVDTSGI